MSLDKDKCPTCEEKIRRNAEILSCCICTFRFHLECVNMSRGLYDEVKPEMENGIMWCCDKCKLFGGTVVNMINHLSDQLQQTNETLDKEKSARISLEEDVKKLESRLKTLEKGEKLNQESKTYLDAAFKKYSDEFPALDEKKVKEIFEDKVKGLGKNESLVNFNEKLEETEQKIREDQREIEIRKKNCIIHNLKEFITEDKEVSKEKDLEALDNLMKDCEADGKRPVFCIRLGKKEADANKARPLKVIFEKEEEKMELVKKYCIAKREGSTQQRDVLGGISIVPDRTIKEREEYKKLKLELEERSQKGEKNLVIRNWKIRQKH